MLTWSVSHHRDMYARNQQLSKEHKIFMLQRTDSCVFRLLNTMYKLHYSVSLLQPDEGFATSLNT